MNNKDKLILEYMDDFIKTVFPAIKELQCRWKGRFIGMYDYEMPTELEEKWDSFMKELESYHRIIFDE